MAVKSPPLWGRGLKRTRSQLTLKACRSPPLWGRGLKLSDATPDCAGRIMNGWWSARYDDDKDVQFTNGLWELPLTEAIAKDCARGDGGAGKDLDLMITSGSCTINSVYYEE